MITLLKFMAKVVEWAKNPQNFADILYVLALTLSSSPSSLPRLNSLPKLPLHIAPPPLSALTSTPQRREVVDLNSMTSHLNLLTTQTQTLQALAFFTSA